MSAPLPQSPALSTPQSATGNLAAKTSLTCDSRTLLAGSRELVIVHHGEPYRLRETRQGKLILTK